MDNIEGNIQLNEVHIENNHGFIYKMIVRMLIEMKRYQRKRFGKRCIRLTIG